MKKILFMSIVCSLMIACASSPSDYQTEINDAVKFYTATWQVAIEAAESDKTDEVWAVRDKITDEYPTVEGEAFKILLEKTDDEWGRKILVQYNLTQPILSEYQPTKNAGEWIFQEQSTGVHFAFRLKKANKKEVFEIEPDEKEAQHYLGRKLIGEKTVQLYEALGINIDSLIDASIAESEREEQQIAAMKEVVDLLYSGKIAEDKVVSFCQDWRQVISGDEDYWAEIGYWKYEDGHTHTYSIDECVLESDWGPYVLITLKDTPKPTQIALEMQQKGDSWVITDVMGVKNGCIEYAFSDYITVALAE